MIVLLVGEICFDPSRLQLRYGKRWGPVHPDQRPMNDHRLVANYSFVKGEFISSILMYSGSVIDGFKIATNVQIYPLILSTGGTLNLPATGQRVMFLSGKVHDNAGDHMVSHVGIYFDSC